MPRWWLLPVVLAVAALPAVAAGSTPSRALKPRSCPEGNPDAVFRLDLEPRPHSRLLPQHGYPYDVSPDGRWLAYGAGAELRVVTVEGYGRRTLATVAETVDGARWSSDGRRVAFVAGNRYGPPRPLWLANRDGSGTHRLAPTGIAPAWSPDSRRLAYVRRVLGTTDAKLEVAAASGGHRLSIAPTLHDPGRDLGHPVWSPRGDWIAYSAPDFAGVDVIRPDGSGHRALYPHPSGYPSWSPDGRMLVLVAGDERTAKDFAIVAVRGEVLRTIDGGIDAYEPVWSPRGDTIVYAAADADGRTQLYAMRPDGTHRRRLTHDPPLRDVVEDDAVTRIEWVTAGEARGRRLFYFRNYCTDPTD